MKSEKGFTLIELVTVVAVIGILSVMAIPSLLGLYNPLKNTASMVDGKMNAMMAMARADRTRKYCIEADSTYRKFSGNSYDMNDLTNLSKARIEPSLNFELPQTILLSRSGSGNYNRRTYDDGYNLPSEFSSYIEGNTGTYCSPSHRDLHTYGKIDSQALSATGMTLSTNEIAYDGVSQSGMSKADLSQMVLLQFQGNSAVEVVVSVNATGQSKISYRRFQNGIFTHLPNY